MTIESGENVTPPYVLKINLDEIDPLDKAVEIDSLTEESRGSPVFRFTEVTDPWSASYTEGDSVILEYDPGTVRFAGKIEAVRGKVQGGVGRVEYECLSYQHLATKVQIVRVPATDGNTPDPFPQRIYNCPEGDPDKIHEEADGRTVGQILRDNFNDFRTSLQLEGAILGRGYVASDFDVMTRVPDKFVLQGDFQQAVQQCLAEQGPGWAVYVVPLTGTWRFYNRFDVASTHTFTIGTDEVGPISVKRSLDGVATAVRVVGRAGRGGNITPEVAGFGIDEQGRDHGGLGINLTALWSAGLESTWTREKMTNYWDSGIIASTVNNDFTVAGRNWATNIWAGGYVVFPTYSYASKFTIVSNIGDTITLDTAVPSGLTGKGFRAFDIAGGHADVWRFFQITDSTKRNILLDDPGNLGCCAKVVVIGRDSNDNVSFRQPVKIRVEGDPSEGKFRTEDPLFQSPTGGREPGDSTLSDHARLEYCYEDSSEPNTLEARYPSSGFSGEAFGAPWNIDRELSVIADDFDDQLDAGLFQTAAQEIHKLTSKVLTRGNVVVSSINWDLHDLRKLVNITHASESTGWEALKAGVASVTWDFDRNSTTVQLSDDGGSDVVDYQRLFDGVRARATGVVVAEDALKTSGFLDCIGDGITNRTGGGGGIVEEGDSSKGTTYVLPEPDYQGMTLYKQTENKECPCDGIQNDPCISIRGDKCPRVCLVDGQYGLAVRHPGTGNRCPNSQLVVGTAGMYFPFMCQGIPVDNGEAGYPDDPVAGACTNNRNLVVLEPATLDDGPTGTEVGIGQALIHFLESYDAYMQHNEDAHCCLDTKILCTEAGVWGGQCPMKKPPEFTKDDDQCKASIRGVIDKIIEALDGINSWSQCAVEVPEKPDWLCCAPCQEDPGTGGGPS